VRKKALLGLGLLLIAAGLSFPSTASSAQPIHESSISALKQGTLIAKIRIPRFGKTYYRGIYEGTSGPKVLNTLGLGHYEETQLPGEEGNFAVAGHRFGYGGPLLNIDKFKAGDFVIVETKTATYKYKWLQTKVVLPTKVGVINPIPEGLIDPEKNGHYLTLQSCTPIHINTHRIVAWFSLEATTPSR
jgi:LPXTG-site transpeptidase (sortase) family protein